MADYWVKYGHTGDVHGPYTGSQLKAFATSGQLSPDALVSPDQEKWAPATRVKGLFAAPGGSQPYQPASQQSWSAPVPNPNTAPRTVAPAPIPYASGSTDGTPANVDWFLNASIAILGVCVLNELVTTGAFLAFGRNAIGAAITLISSIVFVSVVFLGIVGLFIYFTVWAYRIHETMRQLTNGAYPISPGQACGFCYIPVFNLFWYVYMPFKLAEAIDKQMGSTSKPTNPTAVILFQIGQFVGNIPLMCCIFAPNTILLALTMRNIQAGMNQILSRLSHGLATAGDGMSTGAAYGAPFQEPDAGSQKRSLPTWLIVVISMVGLLIMIKAMGFLFAFGNFGGSISHFFSKAREQTKLVQCASNMKQVGAGLMAYANAHGGEFPGKLEDAVATGDVSPLLLICPDSNDTPSPGPTTTDAATNLSNGGHCSYMYVAGGLTLARANADMVLLFEPSEAHEGHGVNLLMGNGQVVFRTPIDARKTIERSRIAILTATRPPPPPPRSHAPLTEAAAGLLANIDPAVLTRSGSWKIENDALCSRGQGTDVIGIPYSLPEQCDITLDFVRTAGDDDIGVAMDVAGSHFMFLMGASHNTVMGVDMVGRNRVASVSETVRRPEIVPSQKPHHLLINVRKSSFRAILDGMYSYSIVPNYSTWKLSGFYMAAQSDSLGLATHNTSVEFRSLRVTPVTGP